MDGLTEHALKSRLAARGARTPAGRLVATPEEAAAAYRAIGGPVMVKGLAAVKDRAALGLISRTDSADATAESTRKMLNRTSGPAVRSVLVEQAAEEGTEYYLAAAFDYVAGTPVLLFGAGGSGVERRAERPAMFPADMEGHVQADVLPSELQPVADALFEEFFDLKAQLVELNPVRVTGEGAIVLDAKAVLDPVVQAPADAVKITPEDEIGARLRAEAEAMKGGTEVRFGRLDGDIGLVSAGGGVLAVVHDAFKRRGLRPANFADVSGGSATTALLGSVAREVVALRPRGVLVVTGITSSVSVEEFARTMLAELTPLADHPNRPPIVARMAGTGEDDAARTLAALPNCHTVGKDVTVEEAVDLLATLVERG